MGDKQFLAVIGDLLDRQTHRRDRHVDDQIDLLDIVPASRDGGADVGLQLMIADDDADRLSQDLAAEILDRILCRR